MTISGCWEMVTSSGLLTPGDDNIDHDHDSDHFIDTCEEEELSKATDCPLNEFVYRCEAIFVMSLSVEN